MLEVSQRPRIKETIIELCNFTGFKKRTEMVWHVFKNFIRISKELEEAKRKNVLLQFKIETYQELLNKGSN